QLAATPPAAPLRLPRLLFLAAAMDGARLDRAVPRPRRSHPRTHPRERGAGRGGPSRRARRSCVPPLGASRRAQAERRCGRRVWAATCGSWFRTTPPSSETDERTKGRTHPLTDGGLVS